MVLGDSLKSLVSEPANSTQLPFYQQSGIYCYFHKNRNNNMEKLKRRYKLIPEENGDSNNINREIFCNIKRLLAVLL